MYFLVGVRPNMHSKVNIPCKTFLTILTLIWFHSAGVTPSVFCKMMTLPSKSFLTIFTLMCLLFRMRNVNKNVLRQSSLPCKTSLTIFTLIWFIIVCVRPNMFSQITFMCEIFLTIFTLMPFVTVCTLVRLLLGMNAFMPNLSFIHTGLCAWKICWCRWIQQLNIPGRWALEYVSKISIFFWRNWAWVFDTVLNLILNLNV